MAMTPSTMLKTGVIGSVVTALCCFTPLLVVAFAALGVSAWLGWADYVLFPALALFLLLTAVALVRRARGGTAEGSSSAAADG
jgi:mercuric ion transport protein